MMNRLRGHKGDVYAVTIFDKYIISAGHDKYIRVYDSSTCKLVNEITAHDHIIHAIEVYHDSANQSNPIVISGSWDTTIKFFDLYTLKNLSVHRYHSSRVRCIAISSRVEIAGEHGDNNKAVLLSGDDDGNIKGLQIATEMILFQVSGHGRFVLSLDILVASSSSVPSIFASGSSDCCLSVWSLYTGDKIRSMKLPKSITCISFVPTLVSTAGSGIGSTVNIRLLVCGCCDGSIYVFDAERGDKMFDMTGGHSAAISGLSLLSYITGADGDTSPAVEEMGPTDKPSRPSLVSISSDGILCSWSLDSGRKYTNFYFNGEGLTPFSGPVCELEGFTRKSLHAIKVQSYGCVRTGCSDISAAAADDDDLQGKLMICLCGADSYLAVVRDEVTFRRTVLSCGDNASLASSGKGGARNVDGNIDGANSSNDRNSRNISSKSAVLGRSSTTLSGASGKGVSRKLLLSPANLVRVNTANGGRRIVSVEGDDELTAVHEKISSELVSCSNTGDTGIAAAAAAAAASSPSGAGEEGSASSALSSKISRNDLTTKTHGVFVKNPNRSISVSTGTRGMASSSSLPFLKLDDYVDDGTSVIDLSNAELIIDSSSNRTCAETNPKTDDHPSNPISEAGYVPAALTRISDAGYRTGLYSSKTGRVRTASRHVTLGRGRTIIESKDKPLPANVVLAPETDSSFDYNVAVSLIRQTLQTVNNTGRLPVMKTFKSIGDQNNLSQGGLRVGGKRS